MQTDKQFETAAWSRARSMLHGFVRKRIDSAEDAEDVLHDVIARALAQRDSLLDDGKLHAWLFRIARNAIADYYRRGRPQGESLTENFELRDEQEESAGKALAQCIFPLLAQIDPAHRRALELADIDGLSQAQTAEILGLSLSGAKSRIQRGREKLREVFLDCCRVEQGARGGIVDFQRRGGPGGSQSDCDKCSGS